MSLSNLQRQVIHDSGTLNELKTQSAADAIAALNPHVRVIRFEERFDEAFAANHLGRFDLLIDARTISTRVMPRPMRQTWQKFLSSPRGRPF